MACRRTRRDFLDRQSERHMRRFSVAALIVLLRSSVLIALDDAGLRRDLAEESRMVGLALVGSVGNRITVISFDGGRRRFRSQRDEPLVLTFGKDGEMVAWFESPIFERPRLTIERISGEVVVERTLKFGDTFPLALSERGRRVAFWLDSQGRGLPLPPRETDLCWRSFDDKSGATIDRTDISRVSAGNVDWSPDGGSLVYEKAGGIYVFDLGAERRHEVARGYSPTWRPGSRQIAFKAPDGAAALAEIDGRKARWALASRRPRGAIQWSPDGKFVAFGEDVSDPSVAGAAYQLVACRVDDGNCLTVEKFAGAGGDGSGAYHWIRGYRRFCHACTMEAPSQ